MRGQQREASCVRKARRMRTVAGDSSGDGGSEKWQRCGALRSCASDWAVQRGGSMGRTLLGICDLHHSLAPVVRSKCETLCRPLTARSPELPLVLPRLPLPASRAAGLRLSVALWRLSSSMLHRALSPWVRHARCASVAWGRASLRLPYVPDRLCVPACTR